jgi:hypothetical protein
MQYAQFNPAAPSPAPVMGWYDTSVFEYPNLPAAANLIAVTASQWAEHFNNPNGWTVQNGQLIAPQND